MALRLVVGTTTDVGLQREQNEDACFSHVQDDRTASGLFVVSDGMGGYHAGEIASQKAVETMEETLLPLIGPTSGQPTVRLRRTGRRGKAARRQENAASTEATAVEGAREAPATQELRETMAIDHYAEHLRNAVKRSSENVVAYGNAHEEARGLGATLTAALIIEAHAFIANVGDSRTYLLRDGKLTRVTEDHSLVERLVDAGQITRDEVYDHPSRNLIYRSLGAGKSDVEVDIFTENLRPGDALLLCSDGLWEMVRDPELESILNELPDPTEACERLVQKANEHGGEDNITAVIVRCLED